MIDSFHFLRPMLLLLLPVVALVWWAWRRRSDPLRGWRSQIEPELLDALTDRHDQGQGRHWPVLTGWILAGLALAGPSWKPEPNPFAEDATPLVILLKADLSMDLPDPEPSRLERAQLKIADLAAARPGQALGLIVYAGSAHLVLPPTKDTAVVADMAGQIRTDIMPRPGDRLDLAIAQAADLLEESGGSLLVITDRQASATDTLGEAYRKANEPFTQMLVVTAPDRSVDGVDEIAKILDTKPIAMTVDDSDVREIIDRATRPPVAKSADGEVRWQDGGYYLLPLIAMFALLPFRRETSTKEVER